MTNLDGITVYATRAPALAVVCRCGWRAVMKGQFRQLADVVRYVAEHTDTHSEHGDEYVVHGPSCTHDVDE